MNGFRRTAVRVGGLAAALALGACATHSPNLDRTGPRVLSQAQLQLLFQDAEGNIAKANGIRDQDERVQTVKTCRTDPCDLAVSVSDVVVPVPGIGFNCGVGLDFDIVLMGRAVSQLGWLLKEPPAASKNVFRFTPGQGGRKDLYGVYVYADPDRKRFVASEPRKDYFVLTAKERKSEGFAYGIYLDWKPRGAPDSDYQRCIGLDPVIIEHD